MGPEADKGTADEAATDQKYDFIIVGSGFGGSVSAYRLSQKGYRVLVIEAGKRWSAEDFPKTNWSIRKFLWLPKALCYGIFRMNLLDDVLILGGAGVGGGSLVYANTLLVPPAKAFGFGWPGQDDWQARLAPHFETAKRMLGVTPVPRDFPADRLLAAAAEAVGVKESFRRTDVGVYFGQPGVTVPDPYFEGEGPERTGCNFCGGCMIGCRFGAKNTLDKNYLYFAERLGAEVLPETKVELIRAVDGGYAIDTKSTTGLFGRPRRALKAKQVVVSAGVLGTTRLLFECRSAGALPELSQMLGAKVRTNSESIIGATARTDDEDYSQGVAIGSGIHLEDGTHVEAVRYSRGSDALSFLGTLLTDGGDGLPRFLRWMGNVVRHPVDFLRSLSPFGWARRTIILLVMQTEESNISLRMGRRWYFPFVRALRSRLAPGQPRIPTYIPAANAFAREVARLQNGYAASSINEVALDVPTTAHILGGCTMGSSAEDGVVGVDGQAFGHPGLYVVDGSVIPANLGVNPSLTITAVAEMIMASVPAKEKTVAKGPSAADQQSD